MIKQTFIVSRRYWKVYACYDVDKSDSNKVIHKLKELNLPKSYIESAYEIISTGKPNQGITCSNVADKVSMIVITKTTSASQFVNSFAHEIAHLTNHIARTYNIDMNAEEFCYIFGDIAQDMFSHCHALMCDCCRDNN